MKFLRTLILSLIVFLFETEIIQAKMNTQQTETWRILQTNQTLNNESYEAWSKWGSCSGGHRTRRRHCLQVHICGGTLRVQVIKCKDRLKMIQRNNKNYEVNSEHEANLIQNMHGHSHLIKRQMNHREDIQKHFRGFSVWTPWTPCSRKCTTIRKRYCRRPLICGNEIIRQSAYCYLEGSYCQRWIRGRLQRRQDAGYNVVSTMSTPVMNKKDQAIVVEPECGVLGKFRGSPAARMRARMKDMLRIIGGRPAAPGKWPWQVAVLNRFKEAFCGGTLVSVRWVVTAAHCVRRRLFVRLGEYDILVHDRGEIEMRVTEAVIHPNYDPDTVINDVAMLRLPVPARPDLGHGVACLPSLQQPLTPRTNCVILGWGKRRATDSHGTRILHEAQVSTIQQGVCRRSYWQYAITDNMVCAGRGRRDSCAGDSGGPLLCRDRFKYYLQGITSFGDGCGKRGKYGIYTRTAGYVSWMRTVMNKQYYDD